MQNQSNLWYESTPEIKLDDLVLHDSIRKQIQSLRNEHHSNQMLHEYSLRARNMVLITGLSGNGKTLLAEAIAHELIYPIIRVRYENLMGSNAGETLRRFSDVLNYAKTGRFVLFLDAFETLGKKGSDPAALLSLLDEVPDHVVIVAATGHPERLDRAAWRRFQVKVHLPAPTQAQKIEYIASIGRRCGVDFGNVPPKQFDGLSFAETEQLCLDVVRRKILSPKSGDGL